MTRSLLFSALFFSFALNAPAKASTPSPVIMAAPTSAGCDSCGEDQYCLHLWDDFCSSRKKHHLKQRFVRARQPAPYCGDCCELPPLRLPKWNWPKWPSSACNDCQTVCEPIENARADCTTGFKFPRLQMPHFKMPKVRMPHLACHLPHWDWKSSCASAGHRLDVFGVFRHHGEHCCDASGDGYLLESHEGQMGPAIEGDAGPAIAPADPIPMPPADEA